MAGTYRLSMESAGNVRAAINTDNAGADADAFEITNGSAYSPLVTVGMDGLVGIGTTSPGAALEVSSAAAGGTTNPVLIVSTGSAAAQRLLVVHGNGNVGIGTTIPATTLDVNDAAQFGSGVTKSTFSATGALTLPADPTAALQAATKEYVDSAGPRSCVNAYKTPRTSWCRG